MEGSLDSADVVQGQRGLVGMLTGTLVRPRATMSALGSVKRSWWGIPAFLVLAVTVLSVVAYSSADCQYIYQLEKDYYASAASQMARPPEPITPLPITMTIRAVGKVVSTGVAWLAWTGALYLTTVLMGQNDVPFGSIWALVLWSWMPCAVRGVLQSIAMTMARRPIYNQGLSGLVVDNTPPPMMTFSYAFPTANQQALASLLSRLDVFLILQLALLAMGMMALSRFSRRRAIAVVLGIWVAFTLIALIPTFFPGTFARFRYF